jgi:hypothetical protein
MVLPAGVAAISRATDQCQRGLGVSEDAGMNKYIAFGLYQQNEKGGHQEAMGPGDPKPGVAKHVYLAADVDALIASIPAYMLDEADEHYCQPLAAAVKSLMGS